MGVHDARWIPESGNAPPGQNPVHPSRVGKPAIWPPEGTPDRFPIKIFGDNGIVYDNNTDQAIGGSVVIHTGKK